MLSNCVEVQHTCLLGNFNIFGLVNVVFFRDSIVYSDFNTCLLNPPVDVMKSVITFSLCFAVSRVEFCE